ncbi:MAG: hypothetical protein JKY42_04105 [Flavobacteriales bacterium]|nr:hypothetical protein [Flavobacteriales bacterium]
MVRQVLTIVFCCWCGCLFAQEDDNTFVFKVINPVSKVLIEQEDTVLYTDHTNRIRITVSGKNKLGQVQLEGGELRRNNNYFIATVEEGTEAVLVVYVIKPNGNVDLGASKKIPIIHLPDPVPYVGGVKPDSIINRNELLANDKVYVRLERFNTIKPLPVLSFEMLVMKDTLIDTLVAIGKDFTIQMRRYVQTLKPGIPLYFSSIRCKMPDGEIRKLQDMRLFVDCTLPSVVGREEE